MAEYQTLNTMCWSSARAARDFGRRLKRPCGRFGRACLQISARQGAYGNGGRRMAAAMANVDDRTTGKSIFPTRCAAGNTSHCEWRSCTLKKRRTCPRTGSLGRGFDRTKDGRILQRNFGGHRYPVCARRRPNRLELFAPCRITAFIKASKFIWKLP